MGQLTWAEPLSRGPLLGGPLADGLGMIFMRLETGICLDIQKGASVALRDQWRRHDLIICIQGERGVGAYRLSECLKARIGRRLLFCKILSLLQSVGAFSCLFFCKSTNPAKRERKCPSATEKLRKPASALD